jgi:hypothetical protein
MSQVRVALPSGTLLVTGASEWFVGALGSAIVHAESEATVLGRRFSALERDVWIKGDHLPGKARVRHSLRRMLGLRAPREREFANLAWLRARLFRAPEPLAAGVLVRGGLVRYQFLCTLALGAHRTLDVALQEAAPGQRAAWLAELAREVARMHALHFVHRDLFWRNVLVSSEPAPAHGDPRALNFVDCWRGGHPLPRRAADYDIACLMLEGASALSLDEQRAFFALYGAEREHQGSPVDVARLLAAADRRRAELLARIAREPGRWRAAEPPAGSWDWRAVAPR